MGGVYCVGDLVPHAAPHSVFLEEEVVSEGGIPVTVDWKPLEFVYKGKDHVLNPGDALGFLVPGMMEAVKEWIVRRSQQKQVEQLLNDKLAEIQPLHFRVEAARAETSVSVANTMRLIRHMIGGENMDRSGELFVLDAEQGIIRFDPQRVPFTPRMQ